MFKISEELAEAYNKESDTKALAGNYGTNYFAMVIDSPFVLDPKMVVSRWYKYHSYYNYSTGKSSSYAGKFIVCTRCYSL